MAQFDLYQNSDPASSDLIPYIVDVQNDLHSDLTTRLVIPLVRGVPRGQRISRLCPVIVVDDEELILSTPEVGAYPCARLHVNVGSLSGYRSEIVAAIDFLLAGF